MSVIEELLSKVAERNEAKAAVARITQEIAQLKADHATDLAELRAELAPRKTRSDAGKPRAPQKRAVDGAAPAG